MRLYILRALLLKEVHRHLANRGGMALAFLMVVAALLLSVFNPGTGAGGTGGGSLVGEVHRCLIIYPEEDRFVAGLKKRAEASDLKPHIVFEHVPPDKVAGPLALSPGTGAINIRVSHDRATGRVVGRTFEVWHPPEAPGAMAAYEDWFWRAARDAAQDEAEGLLATAGVDASRLDRPDPGADDLWAVKDSFRQLGESFARAAGGKADPPPRLDGIERKKLGAKVLDLRSAIATGMVVFALYFACVYLLPTLNCEERERGVLLAQALSPASPAEILTAKFLFYPALGIALAAVIAGIYRPAVLSSLFFWLALLTVSSGFLGIGMTVATLARTQRAAFMGSMCYLLSVSLILFICSQNGIPAVPWLAIEYHGPRVLHAAITQEVFVYHWIHLAAEGALAACWIFAAGWLFRRRGWQ